MAAGVAERRAVAREIPLGCSKDERRKCTPLYEHHRDTHNKINETKLWRKDTPLRFIDPRARRRNRRYAARYGTSDGSACARAADLTRACMCREELDLISADHGPMATLAISDLLSLLAADGAAAALLAEQPAPAWPSGTRALLALAVSREAL